MTELNLLENDTTIPGYEKQARIDTLESNIRSLGTRFTSVELEAEESFDTEDNFDDEYSIEDEDHDDDNVVEDEVEVEIEVDDDEYDQENEE